MDKPKILIVDDEEGIRTQLKWALDKDYTTFMAEDSDTALNLAEKEKPDIVLLDIALSPYEVSCPFDTHSESSECLVAFDTNSESSCQKQQKEFTNDRSGLMVKRTKKGKEEGMMLLQKFLQHDSLTKVIMITGNDTRENALKAINLGACDFYSKPVKINEIKLIIERSLHIQDLERENRLLHERLAKEQRFDNLIGSCELMEQMFDIIRRVATSNATVWIQGETGTGKELVAKAIHYHSLRKDKPFVPVDCTTIPVDLLESELFGHEKGAFTGAEELRKGKVEMADGGTLFFDEIAELKPELQMKLLRFLQERYIERLGGRNPIPLDVRVITATSRNIQAELAKSNFRKDLYYRLSVVSIQLPPLRERGDDCHVLANHFLNKFSIEENKKLRGFNDDALEIMKRYSWPGNVRELENKVKRAVIMASDRFITPADLGLQGVDLNLELGEARNKLELEYIIEALTRTNGNVKHAAAELGVTRQAFYDMLKKHRLEARKYRDTKYE
jgi:two-component system NtrC family response regulator